MKTRERLSLPVFGGSSLLAVFGVLALTMFALLSLSTAQADRRLSDSAAEAAAAYYEADLEAERIFARLRSGELPEGVTRNEDHFRYACSVSEHQTLQVELQKTQTGWTVLQWQTRSHPEDKEEPLPVWRGK